MLADGSKIGRATFASVGPLLDIHTPITDSRASPEMVAGLRERGFNVVVAEHD